MSDMGVWREGNWCWYFSWRRRLFTWEEELVETLKHELAGIQIVAKTDDSWCWLGKSSSTYLVKEAYHKLTDSGAVESDPTFRVLWDTKAPLKVRSSFLLESHIRQSAIRTKSAKKRYCLPKWIHHM